MATIDTLVNVTISNETAATTLPSFSIPLIMGTTATGWATGDVVHTYSSPAAMLTDGYVTASPEYLAALSMYSGTIAPASFCVGLRSAGSAADDLSAIVAQNNTWYCLLLAEPNDADIEALAVAIEGEKKILLSSSSTAGLLGASNTSDIGSLLKTAGYNRTGIFYTANANGIAEAAWAGGQLPQTPGSNNWAYKTLSGVAADNLTASHLATLYGTPIAGLPGKNVNTYTAVAGTNVTFPGMMASGQYIDITIGLDWLQATIQTQIFALLSSSSKVPYTDAGAAMLMSVVRGVLAQAQANGLIDGTDPDAPISVTCESVSAVARTQRAARIAPTVYFTCKLSGAFNSISVAGTVSV